MGINLQLASRQSHPAIRLATAAFAGLVLVALLVTIAHNTVHLGSGRYSYYIEEWVYDFITMSAAPIAWPAGRSRATTRLLPIFVIGAFSLS